jgi:hypothetical protein
LKMCDIALPRSPGEILVMLRWFIAFLFLPLPLT